MSLEIRHSTLVRAPVERVWEAFTTAKGLDGWFTSGAEVDPREDGRIRFRSKEWGPERITAEDGGPVLEVDPPKRFVFRWHEGSGEGTVVALTFEPVEMGTVVQVTDSGYPQTPQGRELLMDCAAGWGETLTLLKFYVEHGLRY